MGGGAQCDQSDVSPPKINITFADKTNDVLELRHERGSDSSPRRCAYTGYLRKNPSSIVAVTGCLAKPGDKLEITILSEKGQYDIFTTLRTISRTQPNHTDRPELQSSQVLTKN